MFKKPFDFVAVGDITTDAFIRLKEAEIHCRVDEEECQICMPFGEKIPFEYVKVIRAVGNAPNAAVAAARLGLRTALVANMGDDQNGRDCMAELIRNKVATDFVRVHKGKPTNYHFVLWYEADRTILVNHVEYDYRLPAKLSPPKWLYLTSLADNTLEYHMVLADFLEAHPEAKMTFQPGTFQMEIGTEKLSRIYRRSNVFVVNKDEAERILSIPEAQRPHHDVKHLLSSLAALGPEIVIITDNTNGAYMYDDGHYYFVPMYPDPRKALDRTGCGDAFASTFTAALCMGKAPLEAFLWAPINPMSVAQFVGAQEGLLPLEQLEWWVNRAPAEYRVKEI